MQIVVVTQARYSSTRLPGKILKKLGSTSVLGLHLMRIKHSKKINSFMVATTFEPEAKVIEEVAKSSGFQSFQGDLHDVLDRFYQSIVNLKPDVVIRVTSDCPLIDAFYIDDAIDQFMKAKVDYASNSLNPTLPDGMDVEVMTFKALESAWQNAKLKSEREHVTSYIRDCGKFKILSIEYPHALGDLRLTLDTEEDYQVLSSLVDHCGVEATLMDFVSHLKNHPEIARINSKNQRNENYKKSEG